MKLQVITKDTA